MKLEEVVRQFLRDCENNQRTRTTLLSYEQRLCTWTRLLATICNDANGTPVSVTELERVTVDHLRQCVQHMLKVGIYQGRGRTPDSGKALDVTTVCGYIRVCKSFFNWCYAEELLDVNPVERLKFPKAAKKIVQTFTSEHIDKILSSCNSSTETGFRDFVILSLLLDTGIRLSEVCGLKVTDIRDDYIKVFGKGRKEREVGITPDVQSLLWKYINKHRCPADPDETALFIGRGTPLTTRGIQQMLERVQQAAGLENMKFSAHVFRHTFAKMYKDNQGDTFNLSREMGHSSIRVTEIYLQNFGSTEARREHTKYSPMANIQLKKYGKARGKRQGRKK